MTPKLIRRNYIVNKNLSATRSQDLIFSQMQVGDFCYGKYTTNYCGCSWIAIYNTLLLMQCPQPPERIIAWMESHCGLLLAGKYGAFPWSVAACLRSYGLTSKMTWGRGRILAQAEKSDLLILFYIRRDFSGHYIVCKRHDADNHWLLNEQCDNEQDVRPLTAFVNDSQKRLVLGITILGEESKSCNISMEQ